MRFGAIVLGALIALGVATQVARADDLATLQAFVTRDGDDSGLKAHGVFRLLRLVESPPYAFLLAEFGADGSVGRTYLFENQSGHWSIVARKERLTASMLASHGVAESQANLLVGANCPLTWFLTDKQTQLGIYGAKPGTTSWHANIVKEPLVQTVVIPDRGKRVPVNVVISNDVQICTP